MRLEHLPGDVFPLPDAVRLALAARPRPGPGAPLLVPARESDLGVGSAAVHGVAEADALPGLLERWEARLAAFEPPVASLDALRSLGEPGATCVLAALRPGLAGGPLAGGWSVLHAVGLARALARSRGVPVVPLVYLDTSAPDADRGLVWIGEHFDLVRLGLSSLSGGTTAPGLVRLDEERHRPGALRERLRQLGGALPIADALETLTPRPGELFADAATRALLDLFGALGAVVVRPEWLSEELARALAAALPHVGGTAGDAPLVRGIEGARVRTLSSRDGGLVDADEPGSRTASELAAEVVDRPAAWHPAGALVLPALAGVLPVLAEAGDGARFAARAAARAVEAALGLEVGFVPVLGTTLVDARARASLERLGLDVGSLLRAGRVQRDLPPPPPVLAELRAIADRAREELLAQRAALRSFDPGLAQRLRRVAADVADGVGGLCDRADRLHANRAGKEKRHVRRVEAWLCPGGGPQAATLSLLQAVATWGRDWIPFAAAETDPFATEHRVVQLGPFAD